MKIPCAKQGAQGILSFDKYIPYMIHFWGFDRINQFLSSVSPLSPYIVDWDVSYCSEINQPFVN